MKSSETLRTAPATSSTDKKRKVRRVDLKVPRSWRELNQTQLRYIFDLIAAGEESTELKTLAFLAFSGLKVDRKTRFGWRCLLEVDGKKEVVFLETWMIQSFIQQLEFIDQMEDMDCRLDAVCGLHAVDTLLQKDVSFGEYLYAEKYYQKFIGTKNIEWMDNVAMWLYHDKHGHAAGQGNAVDDNGKLVEDMTLTAGERIGTLLWYSHVKKVMSEQFRHFFKKVVTDSYGESESVNFIEQYNVQLRALTDGDPTKEKDVLALECWRALTELDAKARESEELDKIRNKK